MLRGLAYVFRTQFAAFSPVIVFSATLLVGYSLSMGNVGAAFRMRAQVLTLLFLFASLGQYLVKARKKEIPESLLLQSSNA